MPCETVRWVLYRLLEDRLLPDDARSVRAHVERCAPCARRLREIGALDEAAMQAEAEQPPASLRPKLLAAYRRVTARRPADVVALRRRLITARRAAAFALVVLGSGLAVWMGTRQTHTRPHPQSRSAAAPGALHHVFPLRLETAYTVLADNGCTQRGVRIEIVD